MEANNEFGGNSSKAKINKAQKDSVCPKQSKEGKAVSVTRALKKEKTLTNMVDTNSVLNINDLTEPIKKTRDRPMKIGRKDG